MAEYLIQGETLTELADVIREKTGSTVAMTPSGMIAEIDKLADVSSDTVTAAKMLSGTTAHDKSGSVVTGTIATKNARDDITVDGNFVTVPSGYYENTYGITVKKVVQATPSITVDNSNGLITTSVTQDAGYVSAGTKSATEQLTVQAAQTITPGTSDQTIASGKYLTGTQTIKGDANLVPENIASGVSIFGVEGTMETSVSAGVGAPDAVVAIEADLRGDRDEGFCYTTYIPFTAGMTWRELYNSNYNPYVSTPAHVENTPFPRIYDYDEYDYPHFIQLLDMGAGMFMLYPVEIKDANGNEVGWDDVIQPFSNEGESTVYTAHIY